MKTKPPLSDRCLLGIILALLLALPVSRLSAQVVAELSEQTPASPVLMKQAPTHGTFYLLGRIPSVPYPFDPYHGTLPIYAYDGVFFVDDSQVSFMAQEFSLGEGGGGMMLMSSPSPPGGGTNYGATNLVCHSLTNFVVDYRYATNGLVLGIAQSTNSFVGLILQTTNTSASFDIFGTTNIGDLALPTLGRTNWVWLARISGGTTNFSWGLTNWCERYFQAANVADTDGDGLSDAFETLVFHSDPSNGDQNTNGILDGWEWSHFGSLQPGNSDFDGDGASNLTEYQTGSDPNKIRFAARIANFYVSTASVPSALDVQQGVPFYQSILVDSTNFQTAVWTAYGASNVSISLPSSQGWHDVWIGLRGRRADSKQTWQWRRLKLDAIAPVFVVTNLASTTVSVPLLQLKGYCPEELASISYDITNATGLSTNREAWVSDQFYSRVTREFTTNYFACVDVELTNGLNVITLRARDRVGNIGTTNISITLDYSSRTNPPAIQLFWPQNGEKISGTQYKWRGWVDDPSATITARIVDSGGTTNARVGFTERNGNFWVENMPMSGTNQLTLTVTDSAGQISVTNITVYPSPVTVTMTPIATQYLWDRTVTATGTLSDSAYSIWVNGVKAGVTNGTWTATNVPMSEGGVAHFKVMMYEPGETQPDGSHGN